MMMLPLSCYGPRTKAGIKMICWILLLIFSSADLQRDMTKKSTTDLECYQNYTLKENFCYCTWRSGEESENAHYNLNYYCDNQDLCDTFDAGNLTYYILKNDQVSMKDNISVSVVAKEDGQEYHSAKITIILDKAVKLDPPDQKNFTIGRNGSYVTIHWMRIERFSDSMKTIKEVQYKTNEHSLMKDHRVLYRTNNSPSCIPAETNQLPICQESCTLFLDGHQGHHIQIRQKYEEGVWSEWSDSVFVPAGIGYILEASHTLGKLNSTGIRTIKLKWKPSTEEQGDVKYDISLTLLPCLGATATLQTKVNLFHSNISGAAYNLTVIASNEAEKAPPWSSVIEEDWTGIPFESVILSGSNLTINWNGIRAENACYCIEWRPTTVKGIRFSNLTRYNEATIFTDDFLPMQCYRISVHKLNQIQRTMGTTYYFRPSLSIGPGNFTVVNVTAHSVLLEWDAFDLRECHGLLKNWVINYTDLKTNVSRGETCENSSVTQYLVPDLPLGFSYTFEVKGISIYGEQTGSSFKSVSSPGTALNDNSQWLLGTIVAILLVLTAGGLMCFSIKSLRIYLCPVLPDPSNSNAAMFLSSDNKYISSPKNLIDTCSEDKHADPLKIEPSVDTVVKEAEITDLVITKELSDTDLVVMAEGEAEIDLQFEYRKQVVTMIPGSEKETSIHFFRKLKDDDFAHHTELSKETDALLILNKDEISV